MSSLEGFGKGAAVRLENLTKHSDETPAVRGVSLEIGAGELGSLALWDCLTAKSHS